MVLVQDFTVLCYRLRRLECSSPEILQHRVFAEGSSDNSAEHFYKLGSNDFLLK